MQTLLKNKGVGRNYEIKKKFEAGIELRGFEVKSVRQKKGSLKGAHITVRGGEAFLLNAHIPPYQPKNAPDDFDPYRKRRLLLHKKELRELASAEKEGGLTIVPLAMYNTNSLIKLEIAIVRGKKKHDKREDIKKRDMQRDTERTLKRKNL